MQIYVRFLLKWRLRAVLCVVLVAADFPQVRFPGFLAAGSVLLLLEGCLIIGQRREVLRAGLDRCLDVEETGAGQLLTHGDRSGALIHIRFADVQTRAVRTLGGCLAVRTDQVRSTGVTVFLFRLGKTTLHVVNTGCILYFSHLDSCLMITPKAAGGG